MAWIREGECCKCGDCCIASPYPDRAAIDGMCPNLVSGPNGTRICSVHNTTDEYWSEACALWPTKPEHTAPYSRCTFTWRWEE
jgi:hypothetical protein